ncbi:conserved hypothetical protein [Rhodobacteraceae bacterium KLH11]|nr:conserved hypothetical protein [Rhodobacteraceae bacterium KLH11]
MRVLVRVVATLLMALWLSSSVLADDKDKPDREGGIIGTGIIGTITHLGSIHVNGQHIQIDDQMPVRDSVPPITAGQLKPGHTVAVIATQADNGWHAQHIRQVLPLIGPVSEGPDGRKTVLGTQVETDGQAAIQIGDWVAVSGLWQGRKVRASRIEKLTGNEHQARLSGTYLGPDPKAPLVIGQSVVNGIEPEHLQPGDLVRVYGEATLGGIRANRLETGLFAEAVGVVLVEGYYSEPQPSGLYTVLGSGLVAYSDQPEMIDEQIRVIRCGEEGKLVDDTSADQPGSDIGSRAELGC